MFFKTLLYVHIITGALALVCGALALFTKKGSTVHMLYGKLYYLSMYSVSTLAIVMSVIRTNPLLLSIGIFALYITISGKKAIDYFRIKSPQFHLSLMDRIPSYVGFLTSLMMITIPMIIQFKNSNFTMPVISIFGLILLLNSYREIKAFSNKNNFRPGNKKWLLKHIGMMTGAYISTFTAFLVNNITTDPHWIAWTLPTFVGVPFIFSEIKIWKEKLKIA